MRRCARAPRAARMQTLRRLGQRACRIKRSSISGDSATRLRLDTLVRLRWLAVAGQSGRGRGRPCSGLASAAARALPARHRASRRSLNLGLRWRYPVEPPARRERRRRRCSPSTSSSSRRCSYLTGGLENPFAMLFLAPVHDLGDRAAAAADLRARRSSRSRWRQCSPSSTCRCPGARARPSSCRSIYRAGIWIAILLGLAFIGVYAWRVAEEARQLAQALAATELVLAREQHLSQLDGLAAAAAHELGTPLATIALVAKELERHRPDRKARSPRTSRCCASRSSAAAASSRKLTSPGRRQRRPARHDDASPADRGGGRAATALRRRHRRRARRATGRSRSCRRNPGILYGLGNLVENAVDFAGRRVAHRRAMGRTARSRSAIGDDGPGFPPEVLRRLGEPYVTTRGGGREIRDGEAAASGSASSSPRRCSSAPAPARALERRRRSGGGSRRPSHGREPPSSAAFGRKPAIEPAYPLETKRLNAVLSVNQAGTRVRRSAWRSEACWTIVSPDAVASATAAAADQSLLIVDDDRPFLDPPRAGHGRARLRRHAPPRASPTASPPSSATRPPSP